MRLIDADALRFWTAHHVDEAGYIANFAVVSAEDIENAPTIDAEPVKHGHWIPDPQCSGFPVLDDDEHLKHYKCSVCGRRIGCLAHSSLRKEKPYCHCGAKMDEEVADEQ